MPRPHRKDETANLERAWAAGCSGARGAGRDPGEIELGLIFHTAYSEDRDQARTIAKAIAAGYYEYSPYLFDAPGFAWRGPDVHALKDRIWPDFHHHRDPEEAGAAVAFLDDATADGFALHGNWTDITRQLERALNCGLPAALVLPHPVLPAGATIDYLGACASNLVRAFAD